VSATTADIGRDSGARWPTALAWSLWGLSLLLAVVGIWLLWLTRTAPRPNPVTFGWTLVVDRLTTPLAGALGALIASRRPRLPIGWLLLAITLGFPLVEATESYARYAVWTGAALPGWRLAAWMTNWVWALTPGVLPLVLLLFPTGRPLSRRWAVAVRLAWLELALLLVVFAVLPGPLEEFPGVTNPVGWSVLPSPTGDGPGALVGLFIGLEAVTLVALVGLVVRFWRSRGDERLQLKWIAWGAGVLVAAILVAPWIPDQVGTVGEIVGGLAMFTAVGAAMLKYRLYEIDRIVSRTVTYAVVTGLLVSAYAGSVVALRALLTPVTGTSDLAVAGSTLVVAALFGPVRRRVQGFVDRRFNRQRYDAARAVEAFGQRLRDEVDLDHVAGDLRTTVASTVAPATVSVWLADPEASR
jgi:hypothetical protein